MSFRVLENNSINFLLDLPLLTRTILLFGGHSAEVSFGEVSKTCKGRDSTCDFNPIRRPFWVIFSILFFPLLLKFRLVECKKCGEIHLIEEYCCCSQITSV